MNNLKRILSLALASVMLVGMMVVGASAAEFTDGDNITHDAAVDTMTALGIIGGYDDGSFRPEGNVTRAQMAKMISVALNGGKDPVAGLTTGSQFVDVAANHWALDYITYCANLGIISGKDATHFDPEGNVKANEAAKMLLVAIGYDSDTFGFTGANWSTNVIRMATTLLIGGELKNGELEGASSLNLFDGLEGVAADAELTRDQAAQLIYNGIQANSVKMSLTGVVDNKPSYTYSLSGASILESKFGATVLTGVLTAVDYTDATKNTPATWDYTVTYKNDKGADVPQNYTTTLDVSDLFMQQIRVVSTGKDNNVLSITAAANDVVSSNVFGALKQTKDKAGTVIKLDGYQVEGDDASVLPIYSLTTLDELTGKGTVNAYTGNIYDEYRLIDNDSDGDIDCVVVVPVTLTTVKSVATKAITLTVGGQVTFEGNDIEAGLTKGAYVTVTASKTGAKTVKAAETMSGKVDASRTTNGTTTLRIDGKWYTVDKAFANAAELNGSECDLVLVAGYIVAGKAVEAVVELSDAVMVVTVAKDTASTGGNVDVAATDYLQIRVLKNDNTTAVLNVVGFYDPETKDTTEIKTATDIKAGEVYTYTEDPDAEGFYLLTAYAGEGYTEVMDNSDVITVSKGIAKQDDETFRFDNDAPVFVLAGSKYAVVKGSDVNAWGATEYTTAAKDNGSALYAVKSSNGFTYVQLGFLILDGETRIPGQGATSSTGFGIVTANTIRVYDSNNKQYALSLTIWNGEEEIEVLTKEASSAAADTAKYPVGTVVTYTDNNNGYISELDELEGMDAVTAFDGNDTIKFAEAGKGDTTDECIITKDTVIIYVDMANGTGATGTIALATPVDEDDLTQGYYANVWVSVDNKQNVEYLIVDVSNMIDEEAIVGATKKEETHTHTFGAQTEAATGADCQTAGTAAYYECTECNKKFESNADTSENATEYDPAGKGPVGPHSWTDADSSGTACTNNGCDATKE